MNTRHTKPVHDKKEPAQTPALTQGRVLALVTSRVACARIRARAIRMLWVEARSTVPNRPLRYGGNAERSRRGISFSCMNQREQSIFYAYSPLTAWTLVHADTAIMDANVRQLWHGWNSATVSAHLICFYRPRRSPGFTDLESWAAWRKGHNP
jgi:hypothetical protein